MIDNNYTKAYTVGTRVEMKTINLSAVGLETINPSECRVNCLKSEGDDLWSFPLVLCGVHMNELSFKERVVETAISQAKVYEDVFLKYDYLICSKAFSQSFYVLSAEASNYRHLIGVNTAISANDFFAKCLSGQLTENDFDFCKKGQSEKSVKGSVREKITALPTFLSMLNKPMMAQETFVKNRVHCSFATTEKTVTVGFAAADKARPMTLLRGNKLDDNRSAEVDLVLRRSRGDKYFDEIVCGDIAKIDEQGDQISSLLSPQLRSRKNLTSI